LSATTSAQQAIIESELSLVCVGTPSRHNGSLDTKHVRNVCGDIGAALRDKAGFHVVVMRSTMLPGTMRETVIPLLELASGKRAGVDFGICNNPEFLREGTAIRDYYNPAKTVIGELESCSSIAGDKLAGLYETLDAPLVRTSLDLAEMVKYVDNVWHALKVGFANEIGRVCKAVELDSHSVMDIFVQDTKLNISAAYLRPGFAFGGSCLPKDLRALSYLARTADVDLPILNAVQLSNSQQVDIASDMIIRCNGRKIGILGLSFKAGTDDLRESPVVEVVERLIGKGFELRIFDCNVNLAQLVGANRDYILEHIPHVAELFVASAEDAVAHADVLVIGNNSKEFAIALESAGDKRIVDLVRLFDTRTSDGQYQGLSW
jgi:GDP-mannose 6-dehydrogenase